MFDFGFETFKVVVLHESDCVLFQLGFFVVVAGEGVHSWSEGDDGIVCALVLLGLEFFEDEGRLVCGRSGCSVSGVHCEVKLRAHGKVSFLYGNF